MLACLTSIFSILHILIDGENNSTEGGMPFPKLGPEVQSLLPLPRGRPHCMPACVAALEQRTESVSSGARTFPPPIRWGVLLLQTANNKKRQLMHSPYWLPHSKGSWATSLGPFTHIGKTRFRRCLPEFFCVLLCSRR